MAIVAACGVLGLCGTFLFEVARATIPKHMRITLFIVGCVLMLMSGCTVVSANRVFPKVTWYWSADAKEQRAERAQDKQYQEAWEATNGYPQNRPKYSNSIPDILTNLNHPEEFKTWTDK